MTRTTLTAVTWQEDKGYVSLCPKLGVASAGENPTDALEMLKEAVELYLENAQRLGIWEDVKSAIESPRRFTAPLDVSVP